MQRYGTLNLNCKFTFKILPSFFPFLDQKLTLSQVLTVNVVKDVSLGPQGVFDPDRLELAASPVHLPLMVATVHYMDIGYCSRLHGEGLL